MSTRATRANFNTYPAVYRSQLDREKHSGIFPGKCVRSAAKTMVVNRKKPECTSSVIFGVGTTAKCCKLKRSADRVRSRTQQIKMKSSKAHFVT